MLNVQNIAGNIPLRNFAYDDVLLLELQRPTPLYDETLSYEEEVELFELNTKSLSKSEWDELIAEISSR